MADSEYIALALQGGYVELSYRLSKLLSPTRIRSNVKVNDGNRHRISFNRLKGEATLTVDGVSISGTHRSSYLVAPGDVYIGGVPDPAMVDALHSQLFTGCISNVRTSTYEALQKEIDLFKLLVKSAGVSEKC
ncbi:HSPG2 [Bugula neritina]|uniref:HSPG2 n=1 Tax=Bugula neritina TaxID=10212 RepID=A0A7J7KK47_BUGNE|nr:HSPG2 [Bugula neritina]